MDPVRVDQALRDLEARDAYSGVVLITRGGSQLHAGAYGFASRSWGIRNTLETRFDTASVTKLFTAVAILQLVDEGAFALDTKALEYLELTGTAIDPRVTVEHLLTHTSGIGDDCEEEDGELYEDLWQTRSNYTVLETGDFLPQFAHKPANFAPGEGVRYCNCSFILLGLMIERATGLPYRDYVERHVFARAGMPGTSFLRLDRVHENLAEGCDPLPDDASGAARWKRNIYAFPPVGSPDSGAHATARDLVRFHEAVRHEALLRPETTREFLRPRVLYRDRDPYRIHFGFVWAFYLDAAGDVAFYQKEGINAGVSAVLRHYPARDLTVVLLSNLMQGVWGPLDRVHAMLAES
jgi:CubicO group peptidase (beta-lactamase class C family)